MIKTRRFNDPPLPGEGTRILITRYRPRGVRKEDETWDEFWPNLGPSKELHADAYGKGGKPAIGWPEYKRRYLEEIARDPGLFHLRALRNRHEAGEDMVLLCSSACADEARCHRSLLRDLLASPVAARPSRK